MSKHFGGLAAVKDVCLEIPEGEIFGLIGPNGAGKTTLFSILAGSLRPTSGNISFNGKNITNIKSFHAVKAGIVRTHQIVRPFKALTVLENVCVALHFGRGNISSSAKATEMAMQILSFMSLEHVAHVPAAVLPIGNQKRLELARAIATEPTLLLCDEICGGLTETETVELLGVLHQIRARGITIVFIEHDMKAVMSVCQRIAVLNYGRVLAEGSPHEIQNNQAVIEAYLGDANLS
ncbi:MAG: ABC transporter ATP-binding protein [Pyrinomonadaceae bacterium]